MLYSFHTRTQRADDLPGFSCAEENRARRRWARPRIAYIWYNTLIRIGARIGNVLNLVFFFKVDGKTLV
jgi:hypothetical protein